MKKATKKADLGITKFDAAEFLDSEQAIAEYLDLALKDEDPRMFLAALSDVARAKGMSKIASRAGLGRESLYKSLKPGAGPRFETVQKIIKALGVKVKVAA